MVHENLCICLMTRLAIPGKINPNEARPGQAKHSIYKQYKLPSHTKLWVYNSVIYFTKPQDTDIIVKILIRSWYDPLSFIQFSFRLVRLPIFFLVFNINVNDLKYLYSAWKLAYVCCFFNHRSEMANNLKSNLHESNVIAFVQTTKYYTY